MDGGEISGSPSIATTLKDNKHPLINAMHIYIKVMHFERKLVGSRKEIKIIIDEIFFY